MRILLALLMLVGCPGQKPPVSTGEPPLVLENGASQDNAGEPGEPVGPGPWQEPGGLRMIVPEGWSGRTGPAGSSLLLSITHAATGVQLELWAFEFSGDIGPRPRPHCEWMFVDAASHRAVPALTPAVTATCVSEDPLAPVVQGWYGRVRDREIHLEVVYPPGRVVEGRQLVEPVLASLTSH